MFFLTSLKSSASCHTLSLPPHHPKIEYRSSYIHRHWQQTTNHQRLDLPVTPNFFYNAGHNYVTVHVYLPCE